MDGVYWIRGITAAPHAAIANQMGRAMSLRRFNELPGRLTTADMLLIVGQALLLFEQNYVHLPLKRAMHAVDPVQRLRLLRYRLQQQAENEAQPAPSPEWTPRQPPLGEVEFHKEMTRIFNSVRDLHTNYLLPEPYALFTAFLPFLVEEFFEDGVPRYVVTKVASWLEGHPTFKPGVEVLYWNAMPVRRAIEQNADAQPGSNPDARFARGLATLTFRPLMRSLPPDEEWVVVGFRGTGEQGAPRDVEVRIDWLAFIPERGAARLDEQAPAVAAAQGSDILMDEVNLARKILFAPQAVAAEKEVAARGGPDRSAPRRGSLETTLPGTLRAEKVETASGRFGHVRIYTFGVADADAFVAEFVRLVALLPREGLILDVRGNGGGLLFAGEQLLQVFTPRRIEPERAQFVTTPLNLEICRRNQGADLFLGKWIRSIQQAVETGAQFSDAFPITDPVKANGVGQQYQGPVVLITDALCYSTTDLFAAGFQDHGIGPIIGTSGNTGAGGANVWSLSTLLQFTQGIPDSPYRQLPHGANLRVAIRRTLRAGALAGTPVEDLGVVPDFLYPLSRSDVLGDNRDLLEFAGGILARLPVRRLTAQARVLDGGKLAISATTGGIGRVDVFADGRPLDSVDVLDGTHRLTVDLPAGTALLELQGYEGAALVVSTRVALV
jgi:C-terminal processing protease CtpA/Prc